MGTAFHWGLTGKPGKGLICRGLCVEEGSGMGVSPYRGPVGGPGGGSVYRELWKMDEGGSRNGASLSEKAHCGRPWGRVPLLGTLGYERKALGMGISLHWGLRWANWSGFVYWWLWEMAESDSGGGAFFSLGALWREPGRRAPLLDTLENRLKRLWRWASLTIGALLGNLEGGSSTMDFERWMREALGMEHFFLKRLSVEGLWGGFLYWGPWKIS